VEGHPVGCNRWHHGADWRSAWLCGVSVWTHGRHSNGHHHGLGELPPCMYTCSLVCWVMLLFYNSCRWCISSLHTWQPGLTWCTTHVYLQPYERRDERKTQPSL
jgi:hypothetical protein